jgi:hypothetical protein
VDRRAAAQLLGHARAQLDVHDLVEREPAGHRDQIERRATREQRAQGLGAGGAGALLLERGDRPVAARVGPIDRAVA